MTELKFRSGALAKKPGNGNTTTKGDLARFLKWNFFHNESSPETLPWHPPELSKCPTNINTLEIYAVGGAPARVEDLKLSGKVVKMGKSEYVPILEQGRPGQGLCPFRTEVDVLENQRNPHLTRCIDSWNVKHIHTYHCRGRTWFGISRRWFGDLQKLVADLPSIDGGLSNARRVRFPDRMVG